MAALLLTYDADLHWLIYKPPVPTDHPEAIGFYRQLGDPLVLFGSYAPDRPKMIEETS